MNSGHIRFVMSLESVDDETYITLVNLTATQYKQFDKVKNFNLFLNGIRKIFESYMKELTE